MPLPLVLVKWLPKCFGFLGLAGYLKGQGVAAQCFLQLSADCDSIERPKCTSILLQLQGKGAAMC